MTSPGPAPHNPRGRPHHHQPPHDQSLPHQPPDSPDRPAEDPLGRLPHRDPFRFITHLQSLQPGICAQAIWTVRGDEAFFIGHFPGRPIIPGVLIGEALAQLSGLAGLSPDAATNPHAIHAPALLAQINVRFRVAVPPPVELTLSSRLVRTLGQVSMYDVSASVGGSVVAEGSIVLGIQSDT